VTGSERRRRNLCLNTLARLVEATGGDLRISATYGDTGVENRVHVDVVADGREKEIARRVTAQLTFRPTESAS